MLKKIKNAFSTRKALQVSPPTDIVRELSDDELKQLQKCFLEILKDIDKVCEENNITYMAAGGTALGAIRHDGFIPWDDDVDILMPTSDLKRFLRIFDEKLGDKYEITSPNSKYQIESMITAVYKKNTLKASFGAYNTPFPKGVHIDIFPIVTVPENGFIRRIKGITSLFLQYIAVSSIFYKYRSEEKKKFFYQTSAGKFNYRLRILIGFLFSFRKYEKWANLYDNFVKGPRKSNLWAVPTDIGHYFGHIMPKDVYYPPVKMKFEDMMINVPHNIDEYLKNQYGDYMIIPPVEDREKHYSVGFSLNVEEDLKKGKDIYS
ncbi:LicD family protein [Helcococcus ovis]|uniref:LicD family protein n=1 Tax=Helcococcus ovis TaxID=72026 RepID=UPI0038B7D832